MPLSETQIDALMSAIRQTAAEEIVPRFRHLDAGEIDTKAHAADLVTIADKRAEEVMTERFRAILPGDAVIGEEAISAGAASLDALDTGRCVVIDPIDGTWNFAHGLANYGVLVAVVEEGETVWGCCYDPSFDDWVAATRGGGTWYHQAGGARRLTTNGAARPLSALRGNICESFMPQPERERLAQVIPRLARHNAFMASVVEYRQMCLQGSDFTLNTHLNVWDHAAGALCLAEAGGVSRLLDGTLYRPAMTRASAGEGNLLLNAVSEPVWEAVADQVRAALTP